MTPWNRLNDELAKRHIKWVTFCEALGVAKQTAGHWKHRGIPAKYFRPISEYLGKSIDWLEFGDDDKPPAVWPFETVDQASWERLTERQKGRLEKAINDEIEAIQAERLKGNGTHR